jgi:spore coat protein A, manganese oxidase
MSRVDPSRPETIPKFVDPVYIPPMLHPAGTYNGAPLYTITMRQVQRRLHRDFPETPIWGYEGSWPGPTVEAYTNSPAYVWYRNELPSTHLLPPDPTIHGAEPWRPAVRTVVHLHGANVPPQFDGHPEAWFTPGLSEVGPTFVTDRYAYPNRQRAATLWYHDHAIGITRLNIYAGLVGFYLLRDEVEQSLPLPRGRFEVPLMLQDRSFRTDGSLSYPARLEPEFFGNTITVNGTVWPYLAVEPRRYRLRLLNAANARFFRLHFPAALPVWQIGTDGGLMERPVPVRSLLLSPAERADLIVDFTGLAGLTFTLTNDAPIPFPSGDPPSEHTRQVLQFQVNVPLSGTDTSVVPPWLAAVEWLQPSQATWVRDLPLAELSLPADHAPTRGQTEHVINLQGIRSRVSGRPLLLRWGDAVTEVPQLGTVEVWRLLNISTDAHPIHLHLVRFQILDRQPFDVDLLNKTGELRFTGAPRPPESFERGRKDTVNATPGEMTRIIARFGDFTGEYVWHCHMLEHEDHEMMRRYVVIP